MRVTMRYDSVDGKIHWKRRRLIYFRRNWDFMIYVRQAMYPGFCGQNHNPTVHALALKLLTGCGGAGAMPTCRTISFESSCWNISTMFPTRGCHTPFLRGMTQSSATLGPFPTRSDGFMVYYSSFVSQPPRFS